MLARFIDNFRTDKNTTHSYLDTYEQLFSGIRESATQVIEIGVQRGGSIQLWHDYFPSATIHGVDIENTSYERIRNVPRIKLYETRDAYSVSFVDEIRDKEFDVIIDDGPHTLESLKFCIQHYLPLLSSKGVLILEDIQSMDWIPVLGNCVPAEFQSNIRVYDLRGNKQRYDDVLFVVNRNA